MLLLFAEAPLYNMTIDCGNPPVNISLYYFKKAETELVDIFEYIYFTEFLKITIFFLKK